MASPVKNALKAFIFIILTTGMLVMAGYFLHPLNVDNSTIRIKAFHTFPKNSVDVMSFGSSTGMRSIDPLVLMEEYGINAYNYCGNWQKINTATMFFHEALTYQSPKLVIFELKNVGRFLWDQDMDGEIYYTREASWTMGKLRYLWQCFQTDFERYVSYFLPIYAFHENWSDPQIFNRPVYDTESVVATRGHAPTPVVMPIEVGNNDTEKELNQSSRRMLEDIVATCRERGIEPLFLIVPNYANFYYSDAMEAFAEENNCHFINGYELMDEIGLDPQRDYLDKSHVNSVGARKVSLYLGKYIRENYDLPDARNEQGR